MRKSNQTNALLVELLIVIAFFMLGATILIRVFGASHTLTGKARLLSRVMVEAQNTADALYSAEDAEQTLKQLGFAEGEPWTRQEEGYTLQVSVEQEPLAQGVMNRMQVQAVAGEETLITLPCSRYDPG